MTTPHKHASVIKSWADGAVIQRWSEFGQGWVDCPFPSWDNVCQYRIKPEPKPDTVWYGNPKYARQGASTQEIMTTMRYPSDTVQYTFDGETGVLKAVSLL